MEFIIIAKGANHDCFFPIGQLIKTDALIFFYDFGCFLEYIFFKPESINLSLKLFSLAVKLFDFLLQGINFIRSCDLSISLLFGHG